MHLSDMLFRDLDLFQLISNKDPSNIFEEIKASLHIMATRLVRAKSCCLKQIAFQVLLELDQTLICAYETSSLLAIMCTQQTEAGLKWFELECVSSEKEYDGKPKINYVTVFERPGLHEFLKQLSEFANLDMQDPLIKLTLRIYLVIDFIVLQLLACFKHSMLCVP